MKRTERTKKKKAFFSSKEFFAAFSTFRIREGGRVHGGRGGKEMNYVL